MQVKLGDAVHLRKPHLCGSYEWRVVRLGADVRIQCLRCNRRAFLERREFECSVKALLRPDKIGNLL
jgi:hypothetical protein